MQYISKILRTYRHSAAISSKLELPHPKSKQNIPKHEVISFRNFVTYSFTYEFLKTNQVFLIKNQNTRK